MDWSKFEPTNFEYDLKTTNFSCNDFLSYHYTFSGGKVVGTGSNVIWALWDVKPGTYTITVGVDDGCGVCGETKTKTVVVKECADCSVKK